MSLPLVGRGAGRPPRRLGIRSRAVRLDQLLPGAPGGAAEVEITDLAYDNRRVKPGTLFFCVPGMTRDGHEFAPDAIERGAVGLVVERALTLGVPEIRVESVRAAMAPASARFNSTLR